MALWSLVFGAVCLALTCSSVSGQPKTEEILEQMLETRLFATKLVFGREVHKILYTNELIENTKVGVKGRYETIEGIYCYVTGDRSSPRSAIYMYDLTFFSLDTLRNADALASEGNLLVVMPDVVDYKKMYDEAIQFLSPAFPMQGRSFLTNIFEKIKDKFCSTKIFAKMCNSTETAEASASASASATLPAPPQAFQPPFQTLKATMKIEDLPPHLRHQLFPTQFPFPQPAMNPPHLEAQSNLWTLEGPPRQLPLPVAPSATRRKRSSHLIERRQVPLIGEFKLPPQYLVPGPFAPAPYVVPDYTDLAHFKVPQPAAQPSATPNACGALEAVDEKPLENLKELLTKIIPTLSSKRPGIIGSDVSAIAVARLVATNPTMFQAAVLVSPENSDRPLGACGVQFPLQVYFAGSEDNYGKIHAVLKSTFTDNHHHHVYEKANRDFFGSQPRRINEAIGKDNQEAAASVIAEAAKFFNRMIQVTQWKV